MSPVICARGGCLPNTTTNTKKIHIVWSLPRCQLSALPGEAVYQVQVWLAQESKLHHRILREGCWINILSSIFIEKFVYTQMVKSRPIENVDNLNFSIFIPIRHFPSPSESGHLKKKPVEWSWSYVIRWENEEIQRQTDKWQRGQKVRLIKTDHFHQGEV